MKIDVDYYINNQKYSQFLNSSDYQNFSVYTKEVRQLMGTKGKFLDIGCGPGIVVDLLSKEGINAYGVDVSKPSIKLAKRKRGQYFLYDGKKLPFPKHSFQVVGSFDVIEHVADVNAFLAESLRVLKPNGFLIIATPNFLSITNSYHWRTAGLTRKLANCLLLFQKLFAYFFRSTVVFNKFEAITRAEFQPDDDAVNLMNGIDLLKWGKLQQLQLVKFEGSLLESSGIKKMLTTLPIAKFLTGGVFIVFKKV